MRDGRPTGHPSFPKEDKLWQLTRDTWLACSSLHPPSPTHQAAVRIAFSQRRVTALRVLWVRNQQSLAGSRVPLAERETCEEEVLFCCLGLASDFSPERNDGCEDSSNQSQERSLPCNTGYSLHSIFGSVFFKGKRLQFISALHAVHRGVGRIMAAVYRQRKKSWFFFFNLKV